jgi:hypothetical protein
VLILPGLSRISALVGGSIGLCDYTHNRPKWRRPQGEDPAACRDPRFCPQPSAHGRRAAGRSRLGSNGPQTKVPLRDLRFPQCQRRPPPSRRAGPECRMGL